MNLLDNAIAKKQYQYLKTLKKNSCCFITHICKHL